MKITRKKLKNNYNYSYRTTFRPKTQRVYKRNFSKFADDFSPITNNSWAKPPLYFPKHRNQNDDRPRKFYKQVKKSKHIVIPIDPFSSHRIGGAEPNSTTSAENAEKFEFIGEGGFGCTFRPEIRINVQSKENNPQKNDENNGRKSITKLMYYSEFESTKDFLDKIRKSDPLQKIALTYINYEKISAKNLRKLIADRKLGTVMNQCDIFRQNMRDKDIMALIHMTDGGMSFNRLFFRDYKLSAAILPDNRNSHRIFGKLWSGIFTMIEGYGAIFKNKGLYHFDIKPHNIMIDYANIPPNKPYNVRLIDYDLMVDYNILAQRANLLDDNNLEPGIKSFTDYFIKTYRANYIFYPVDIYILFGLLPAMFRRPQLLKPEIMAGIFSKGIIDSAYYEYIDEDGVIHKTSRLKRSGDYYLGKKIMRVLPDDNADVKKNPSARDKYIKKIITFISSCVDEPNTNSELRKWIDDFQKQTNYGERLKYVMRTVMEKTDVFGFCLFMMNIISRFVTEGTFFPMEISRTTGSIQVSSEERKYALKFNYLDVLDRLRKMGPGERTIYHEFSIDIMQSMLAITMPMNLHNTYNQLIDTIRNLRQKYSRILDI